MENTPQKVVESSGNRSWCSVRTVNWTLCPWSRLWQVTFTGGEVEQRAEVDRGAVQGRPGLRESLSTADECRLRRWTRYSQVQTAAHSTQGTCEQLLCLPLFLLMVIRKGRPQSKNRPPPPVRFCLHWAIPIGCGALYAVYAKAYTVFLCVC